MSLSQVDTPSTWIVTENGQVWPGRPEGMVADAWLYVGQAIMDIACQPPPGEPQPYPDDGVAVWPGTFQLLDDERTARVVYWRSEPGAGPVIVESIITIEPVTGR